MRNPVSPILPGTRTIESWPAAFATSKPHKSETLNESRDIGLTIPVVPIMEIPSTMPNRPLNVFFASFLPPGTDTEISSPPCLPRTSFRESLIIDRGTGFIAGSP